MDFFEVIKKRGSYRGGFSEQQISESDIRKILDAGIHAPSGYNFQTTSFVVVKDKEIRQKIAELMPGKVVQSAPVILVVLTEKIEAENGLSFEIEDYGAATENILLAITALGYAGVWMDGMTRLDGCSKKLKEILNISESKTVRTIIPFGIPLDSVTQREKKDFSERVQYI
ncbi:nitroreductase family protein [Anaerovorax odorimutans]|uniref:nitroreductase family protein n=1 Tax=Anaerovorax odorimutans TaxID=109327 RepID=UPI0003F91224|nr:nitroreductase family protein [Anaerovorax odorimutans]